MFESADSLTESRDTTASHTLILFCLIYLFYSILNSFLF